METEEGDAPAALVYSDAEEEEDVSDAGLLNVVDAFEDFNLRAQQHLRDLCTETHLQLYGDDVMPTQSEQESQLPHYLQMSDHFRLTKPPHFEHWREMFPYLQLTGKAVFSEEIQEHIQIMPSIGESPLFSTHAISNEKPLSIVGYRCGTVPDESVPAQEEIILSHGQMEEVITQDVREEIYGEREENNSSALCCPSPHSSRVEELIDDLTIQCFSDIVTPLVTSLFCTLLEKRQFALRMKRETAEAAAKKTMEEVAAAQEAQRLQEEEKARLQAVHREALAKAREEEAKREAEKQALLLKQQMEENDEQEIKIRTLAYTHTREWHQPNKKCFAHRGRQLTYLKPVLKSKEGSKDFVKKNSPKNFTELTPEKRRDGPPAFRRRTYSSPSTPQSAWSIHSPEQSNEAPADRRNESSSVHVHLPLITAAASGPTTNTFVKYSRKLPHEAESDSLLLQRTSSTVHSPYRTPPKILVQSDKSKQKPKKIKRTRKPHINMD